MCVRVCVSYIRRVLCSASRCEKGCNAGSVQSLELSLLLCGVGARRYAYNAGFVHSIELNSRLFALVQEGMQCLSLSRAGAELKVFGVGARRYALRGPWLLTLAQSVFLSWCKKVCYAGSGHTRGFNLRLRWALLHYIPGCAVESVHVVQIRRRPTEKNKLWYLLRTAWELLP